MTLTRRRKRGEARHRAPARSLCSTTTTICLGSLLVACVSNLALASASATSEFQRPADNYPNQQVFRPAEEDPSQSWSWWTTTSTTQSSYATTMEGQRDLRSRQQNYHDYAELSDIWLCLACALGWTVWLVSARYHEPDPLVFEAKESNTVMGHVLQVSLGEDADGTGIPVYHALVDYVVGMDGENEQEPLQVRKCFTTHKLLEEGFANVEVLVLKTDPTTSILYEDYLLDKKEWERQIQEPPSILVSIMVHLIAVLLIGTSLVGGLNALLRLRPKEQIEGWIILGTGAFLLYPTAVLLYHSITICMHTIGPLKENGVIVHGARDWQCPMNLPCCEPGDAMELVGVGSTEEPFDSPQRTMTSACTNDSDRLNLHSMDTQQVLNTTPLRSPLYPNAGCGFGNFNVQVPDHPHHGHGDGDYGEGDDHQDSSVSSMSNNTETTSSPTQSLLQLPTLSFTVASEAVIDRYEEAVKKAELDDKFCIHLTPRASGGKKKNEES